MVAILPLLPIPPALGGEERTINNPHPRDVPLAHLGYMETFLGWDMMGGLGRFFLFNVWDDDLNIGVAGRG